MRKCEQSWLTLSFRGAIVFWFLALVQARRNIGSEVHVSLGRMSLSTWPIRRADNLASTSSSCDLDMSQWAAPTEQYHVGAAQVASLRTRVRTRPPPTVVEEEEEVTGPSAEVLQGATEPLVPVDVWEQLTGHEFETPSMIEAMTRTSLYMAENHDKNEWVKWRPVDKTTQHVERDGNEMEALERGDILVYAGNSKKEGRYGSKIPMIKTKSIIDMSPKEMAELLMDSSRVKTYNKMSLGRKDIKVFQEGITTHGGPMGDGETKIVRNLTQPPITKKKMLATTMLHARALRPTDGILEGGYVVVSRAVKNLAEETESYVKSEILLGVNVLRNMANPNQCQVTAVTHVYSPSLPTVLASRVGVKSAINFVKDVRRICKTSPDKAIAKI